MMTVAEWKQTLKAGKLDKELKQLYGDDAAMLVHQKKRYAAALDEFAKLYPQRLPDAPKSAATIPITSTAACWRRR